MGSGSLRDSSFIYFTLAGHDIARVDVVDRFCLEQSYQLRSA